MKLLQKAVTNILKHIPQKSIKKSFDANCNIAAEEMYFEIKYFPSKIDCVLLFLKNSIIFETVYFEKKKRFISV